MKRSPSTCIMQSNSSVKGNKENNNHDFTPIRAIESLNRNASDIIKANADFTPSIMKP